MEPASICILRHGEKPAEHGPAVGRPPFGVDAYGQETDHGLTPRGWQRAGALAVLFGPGPVRCAGLPVPTALFAPDYGTPEESAGYRSHQTLQPLAARLGLEIGTPAAADEPERLVQHVLARDGHVVICWRHRFIAAMVEELARTVDLEPTPAVGADWPDERFDVVLVLDHAGPGRYRMRQVPQLALAGDSGDPLPGF